MFGGERPELEAGPPKSWHAGVMATEFHMDGFVARAARALSQVSIALVANRAGMDADRLKSFAEWLVDQPNKRRIVAWLHEHIGNE